MNLRIRKGTPAPMVLIRDELKSGYTILLPGSATDEGRMVLADIQRNCGKAI
jgi:hypothetical protein